MKFTEELTKQIEDLAQGLTGAFPYEDCRTILHQVKSEQSGKVKRYESLIPDLDSYFYLVEAHSSGLGQILNWESVRLAQSEKMLKRSFFQTHPKYRPLEWRINQINTPELYRHLAVSDQLRLLIMEMIDQLLAQERDKNTARQEKYLLSAA
jgi:hypothetical protein